MKPTGTTTHHEPEIKLETITPEMATKYLKLNRDHNRKLRGAQVDYLVDQIKRGLWTSNGATICFNGDGKLTDGQHRMAAVVKAGKAVTTLVVRGLDDKAFHSIDTGIHRSNADILRIAGEKDTYVLACAARYLFNWERVKSFGAKMRSRMAYDDIQLTIKRHPGLRDAVHATSHYRLDIRHIGPSFIATFFYLANIINHDEAIAFLDHVFRGTDMSKGHPLLALRRVLLAAGMEKHRRITPTDTGRLFIASWNLWAKGHRIET
jgi:hypothetical protein